MVNEIKGLLNMKSQIVNKLEPKTKHEEIMFCIESTNDIVSKILEIIEKLPRKTLQEAAREQGLIIR